MESQRHIGSIWLPDSNEKIKGVWLIIEENDIYIEFTNANLPDQIEIIHGDFDQLRIVSLTKTFKLSSRTVVENNINKYLVNNIITNAHIKSLDEKIIDNLTIQLPSSIPSTIFGMSKHRVERKQLLIDDFKQIEVFQNSTMEVSILNQTSFNIGEQTVVTDELYLRVDYRTRQSPEVIRKFHRSLKTFAFFLFGSWESRNTVHISKGKYNGKFILTDKFVGRVKHDTMFTCDEISKEEFAAALGKWIESDKFNPIRELIMERYEINGFSKQRKFQNFCIALETFHDSFIDKKFTKSNNFESELRNKILVLLEANNDEYLWFKKQSSFWSKPDLSDRLNDIKPTLLTIVKNPIGLDVESFLDMVKKTRNDITHYGVFDKRFTTSQQQTTTNYILECLLSLLILQWLGINIKSNSIKYYSIKEEISIFLESFLLNNTNTE